MTQYSYQVHQRLDNALKIEWDQLWQQSRYATMFNSSKWFRTNYLASPKAEYTIFAFYTGAQLVGVYASEKRQFYGITTLSPVGSTHVIDNALLVESNSQAIIRYMFNVIAKHGNIHIPRINSDSAHGLNQAFPEASYVLLYVAPKMPIAGLDPLRYLSRSDRRELERLKRQYHVDLEYKEYRYPDNLDQQLNMMINLDTHSAKEARNMSVFSQSHYIDFYRAFIKEYRHSITISVLYYQKSPVAYIFSFSDKETFVAYQASYLREYKKLSPGRMLFYYLLGRLSQSQSKYFDMCGGTNVYKTAFVPTLTFHYDVLYSNNLMINLWWRCIILVGRLKQRVIPMKFSNDSRYIFTTI